MLFVNKAPLYTWQAQNQSHDAGFPNGKADRNILVIVESRRSSFVSRNVALTLDRSVDVFNSFWLSPTTFFSVLTALSLVDMANSLILAPLSLTPEINLCASMYSSDYTQNREKHKPTIIILHRNMLQCSLLVEHKMGLLVFNDNIKAAYHTPYCSLSGMNEIILCISIHNEMTKATVFTLCSGSYMLRS